MSARASQRASWRLAQALRHVLGAAHEVRASIAGQRFTCEALGGRSSYNITINCDLTVSCNCQDYDGSGHIGDLREQTLEEIFHGSRARFLRRELAAGRLPLRTCSRCPELRRVAPREAERLAETFELPRRGVLVENTVRCNLNCIACARDEVLATRVRSGMSAADIEVVAEAIATCGIRGVSFFNLGEPFLSNRILHELETLRARAPALAIGISTNGMLLDTDEKRRAALLADHVSFSLDGDCQETAARYQVGIDFERSLRNMAALVAERRRRDLAKPLIDWKYVVFRWNDRPRQIRHAVDLARTAGVDRICFVPTLNPVHGISVRFWAARAIARARRRPPGDLIVDLRRG
jgi:uncharacterized Fe-S cluster-containing radical SAM superfamily protein